MHAKVIRLASERPSTTERDTESATNTISPAVEAVSAEGTSFMAAGNQTTVQGGYIYIHIPYL